MAEEKQETEEDKLERIISERVASKLAEDKMSEGERKAQTMIDTAVERSLDKHLPAAIDRFLDKLTGDPENGKRPGEKQSEGTWLDKLLS